jgi:hypothetical protein
MRAQETVLGPDDFAEDILCEMANLDFSDTGVGGSIFISTRMGSHRPRVQWFPEAPQGRRDPCLVVSIGPAPEIRENFLGRVGERAAPQSSTGFGSTTRPWGNFGVEATHGPDGRWRRSSTASIAFNGTVAGNRGGPTLSLEVRQQSCHIVLDEPDRSQWGNPALMP